jgi:hypothetical protein
VRVLVACEFSGVVREAFRKRGHADLWPTEVKYIIPILFTGLYWGKKGVL